MAEAPETNDTSTDGGVRAIEATGKNVDDALKKALAELGLQREQVDIEVLTEGRAGILGVGAQPARVLVTARAPRVTDRSLDASGTPPASNSGGIDAPAAAAQVAASSTARRPLPANAGERPLTPNSGGTSAAAAGFDESFVNQGAGTPRRALAFDLDLTTESAVDVLETLLQLMGVSAAVEAREPETPGDGVGMIAAVLDVTGIDEADMGLLIGRRGETLAALQYMVNLIVNHQTRAHNIFGVDVEGYRRRRETALQDLARRIADRVRQNGQAMTLEPMPPAERRIVHLALADDPDVETVSIGEGDARKVAITPRR